MKALLAVYVTCGFGSFLLAPVALATAKGCGGVRIRTPPMTMRLS